MGQAAVPQQQPGLASFNPPQLPAPATFEVNAHIETSWEEFWSAVQPEQRQLPYDPVMEYLLGEAVALPYTGQRTDGSVRLNMRFNIADVAQQAKLIGQMITRLIGKQDSGIGFSITVSLQQHVLVFSRETGKGQPVHCSVDVPRPSIIAAYLTATSPTCLVLEGYHLQASTLWCFRDSENPIEYLKHERSEADTLGAFVEPGMVSDAPAQQAAAPDQTAAAQLHTVATKASAAESSDVNMQSPTTSSASDEPITVMEGMTQLCCGNRLFMPQAARVRSANVTGSSSALDTAWRQSLRVECARLAACEGFGLHNIVCTSKVG